MAGEEQRRGRRDGGRPARVLGEEGNRLHDDERGFSGF